MEQFCGDQRSGEKRHDDVMFSCFDVFMFYTDFYVKTLSTEVTRVTNRTLRVDIKTPFLARSLEPVPTTFSGFQLMNL